jgi:hypothetical protein
VSFVDEVLQARVQLRRQMNSRHMNWWTTEGPRPETTLVV